MKSCYCCGGLAYNHQWINNKPTDLVLCTKCYGFVLRQGKRDKIEEETIKKYATRQCYSCGKTGIPPMRCYFNLPTKLLLCNYCYNSLFLREKKNIQRRKHRYNDRRMTVFGNTLFLDRDPRIGVCNWCRAVTNIDCKRTNLHHDMNRYDLRDPLKYTIELCFSCHRKETVRLRDFQTVFALNDS